MSKLKEKFIKEIASKLKEQLKVANVMAVPKVEKVTLNVGLGRNMKDNAFVENVEGNLVRIAGQRPVKTLAKKSISNFKIREGNIVGMKVTLRGPRMYDFIEKFVNVTLPRVRDFRGLDKRNIDKSGNLNLGFKENIAFPEIRADEIEKIHGMQVTFTTSAKSREEGLALFTALGFPFKDNK